MKVYPYFLKPATSLCRFPAFHSIPWSRVALLFVVITSVFQANANHFNPAPAPVPPLYTFTFYQNPGTYNYVIPAGVTSITVEVWGGGGRGGSRTTSTAGTGGGGGGAYSKKTYAVTPGQVYVVNVGAGSTSNTAPGGDTWVSPSTVGSAFVLAKGGNSAANNVTTGATGGAAGSGIGDVRFSGGNGGNAPSTTSSGGGGSSAGISANGTNASGSTGGVAPLNGGNGANGRTNVGSGVAGSLPGGGGSGAVRGTTGSPAGGAGAHGKVLINLTFDVNAGADQSQCNNALFEVKSNPVPPGYSLIWSVVSGTGFINDAWSDDIQVTVPAGSSATVRLSVTDGTTTITDDVVLTNTTSCTPSCVNPININGDLEQEGTANAYNLSFQGTPASVIFQNSNPVGWAERYGTSTPNTTSFTGAYYLNKTGVNGDPHGGSKFIYMAGEGYCLSNLKTWQNISCGKTYRVSVWIAAYSNSGTQSSSPFAIEFNGGGPNVPAFAIAESLRAPASASWNNLNWQRYSFEFTIPSNGYEWGDFLFTTYDNVNGIVIDDMCVEEVFNGAFADAGPDQFSCGNTFTMAANTPASGYTGSWSVVSGTASVSNTTSPTSNVTISSGNAARLRWTVAGTGNNTFYAIHPQKEGGFESCCSPYDNGWTAVNNGTNNWVVGEGGGSTGGSQAAYISNDGGTSAAYNITTAQTSHLYRDVTIHPDATNINLQFDWQNLGQSGFDRLLVYTAPTSVDPVAGVPASSSTTFTGATLVSTLNLHSRQHFSNEMITLPASLAGTTFRLIFTWQNNNSGGTNWLPAVVDNVSLSYTLTSCNDFDEMTIVTSTGNSGLTVNNANICPGSSATLTATGCTAGTLLWSTGATGNSITVSPAATTSYSVTCTPTASANLLTNGNFESATNLQGWTDWANASITTTPAHVYAGSKAVFLDGSVSYAGVAQGFATTPGQRFRVRFYAKTTNSNALPLVRYHVYDDISNVLDNGEGIHITSTNYQLYEFYVVTPPNTTWVTFFAETSDKGGLYVDNFEVVSITGCTSTASATVNVGENNLVQNSEFNSGTTSWDLYVQGGAAANLNADNTSQLSGVNSARVNIPTSTGTNWHIQLAHQNLNLEAGKIYELTFSARSTANRTINASVDLGQSPWTSFLYQDLTITTTAQTYTYYFTQATSTNVGRIVFNLGQSNQTVWIDNVVFKEACSLEVPDDWNYSCSENKKIDLVGQGRKCQQNTSFTISNPSDVEVIQAEVIYKDSNPGPTLVFKDANNNNYVADRVQPSGTSSNVWVYRTTLPSTTSVTYTDNTTHCNLQSMVLYIHRNSAGSTQSTGMYTSRSGYNNIQNFTINIPTATENRTITVKVPISELTDDGRYLKMTATAGAVSKSTFVYGPDVSLGSCCLNIVSVVLENVPTTVTQINIEVDTRNLQNGQSVNGQSWVLAAALNAEAVCCPVITAPNAQNASRCGTGTLTLGATPCASGTIRWYDSPTSTTVLASGSSFTTPSISSTTVYYAACDVNGCQSARTAVTATVQQVNAAISGATSVCVTNPSTTLTASGGSSYLWSTGATSASITVSPSVSTTYTVTVTQSGCTATVSKTVVFSEVCCDGTIATNIIAKYNFSEGSGSTINDVSGFGTALPLTIQNPTNVSWIPGCGLRINTATRISSSGNATKIRTALQATNAMTVEAWVQAANTTQNGPARIVSMSSDVSNRNFTLGQGTSGGPGTVWASRTRQSGTNDWNGMPERTTTANSATTNLTHLVFTRDAAGVERFYINGVQNSTWTQTGNFSNWSDYVLHLANEQSNDRPWLGTLYGVTIYNNALSAAQVTQNFSAGSKGDCSNCPPPNCITLPSAPTIGAITQPTCTTPTGSVILSGLPSSGTWTITRSPGGTTYTGTGTTYTVTGLPVNATYSFTVTNSTNCTSAISANVTINGTPASPILGGATVLCVGSTANVTPATGGTWTSSNTAVATITNAGLITAEGVGSATLTFTRTSDGCTGTRTIDTKPLVYPGNIGQPYIPCPSNNPEIISSDNAARELCVINSNNTFNNGTTGYNLYVGGTAAATLNIDNTNQVMGPNSARVSISNAGSNLWDIPFLTATTTVTANDRYSVRFSAKASSNRKVTAVIQLQASPYNTYWLQEINLTTSVQSFTFDNIQLGVNAGDVALVFWMGTETPDVWFDNVYLSRDCGAAQNPTYQWYSRTETTGTWGAWQLVSGQTGATLDPPVITQKTQYKRVLGGLVCSDNAESNTIELTTCPGIFICDSKFYQTREINGDYHLTRIETKPSVTISNLANLTQNGVVDGINSIVFNKYDGYIYGLAMEEPFYLYRIGSDYKVQTIGIVKGFPFDAFINAAEIVNNNIIYRNANDEDLYQLNINTATVTKLCDFNFTQVPQSNVGDIALNPIDGLLYGTRDSSRVLVKYNLSNCTFTEVLLSDSIQGAHGAFFISADGVGYGYQNRTGKFVEINLSTGLVKTVGQDVLTSQTDGCSCDGIKFTKTVSVASTKTCNTYTYHFNFYNQWTAPITNVQFRDTLLNNLTWASNPKNIQNISLGSTSIIGSDKANFTINTIPLGLSSFSIDVHVPQTYNGGNVYSNQAYIHNLPALLPSTKPSDNPLTAAIEDATPITINPTDLTISHSGNVSVCIGASANISTTTSGGTGSGYTYQWAPTTGLSASNIPNPVATPSTTTTYTVTVTDANGCTKTTSVTVTVLPNPTAPLVGAVNQPSCITPTGSVALTGLPSTGSWTITRTPGGTTYTGTGTSYTVTGLPVNTTYTFTVTNSNTCTSPASANVIIYGIPANPVLGGATAVCVGSTANVTPATSGTWTSSNNAVATVSNVGLVTGVTVGSVTLTYTRSSDGCSNTRPFTVNSNPTAPVVGAITQPTCTTPTGSVVLSGLPSTGSWTITRTPGGTTNTGTGTSFTLTGLPVNTTYTFTVTNSNTCTSLASANVAINAIPGAPALGGASAICVGSTANVTPATAGTWASSNNAVATITNAGLVTGVASGSVTLTYTRTSDGCSNTLPFTVNANPTSPVAGAITQPTCTIPTGSVVLSGLPSTGSWTITRTPGGTTYTGTGTSYTVTGLPASTTYTFTVTNSNTCTSPASANVAINGIPGAPVLGGDSEVCVGSTANVTPVTAGTWSSSNNAVATITNAGLVTGVAAGSVTLTYTRTSDGCSNTWPFTVNPLPESAPCLEFPSGGRAPCFGAAEICDGGSIILKGKGYGTPPLTFMWNNGVGAGADHTITLSSDGLPTKIYTFILTVTDGNGCSDEEYVTVYVHSKPDIDITGSDNICVGNTSTVTPVTGGTWSSSNSTVATVTNAGLVSGIAPGTVNLTYTRTSDGCANSVPFTVNSNPTAPVVGVITQPTCASPTGSVVLSGLPATGSWTITRTPGGITYTGTGSSYTVNNLPSDNTFTFTVTNNNTCTSPASNSVVINDIPSLPTLGGDNLVCVGGTANVTPSTGGAWSSSNTSIATVTNAGLVTGAAPGMVILTFTRSSNGCSGTREFTVYANPTAPMIGAITQPNCSVQTGSVVLNGLPATGNYTINQSPGGISFNASGASFTINGLSPNTNYTFTVTSAQNCTSPASASVSISGVPSSPSVSIDFNGSVCLEDNKELSAIVTGGTAPFSYLWNGPSGYTASTQTVVISTNGNYYLTVTDANLCTAVTSGFVYERYEPFVVSLQTKVCEGQNVVLDVNSPSAVTYLWGNNAGNGTTKMVTVTPQVPSSTYLVTVTNGLGCTAVPEITIDVDPRPVVSVTGSDIICQEQTTQLSPSTGGVWSSTNPGVATVNNSGLVTGISAGTATFVFTNSTTNCASLPSAPVTVHAKPVVVVTGPNPICIGQTTTLSPSSGGTWTSSNVAVATVNNSGIVTGISTGSATFTFINSSTSCVSNASTAINVQNLPSATITGNGFVCELSNISLSASVPGGTWTSSNQSIAIVNNSGIVSGLAPGTVTITYQYGTGVCSGQVQKNIEVLEKPVITYTGDQTICVGQTTTLSSGLSGNWTSSNPMIATINQSGVVTGISGGMVTFTFENVATGCLSDDSEVLTVYDRPAVSLTGPSNICLGGNSQVTPTTGGVWTSSNPLVTTITNNGVITSVGIGTTTFTFTDNLTGCSSDGNISVSVGASLSAAIDYHGSICLSDTSKLSAIPSGGTAAFTYQWVGPLGFTGNTQTIDINTNGNYFVTITDALGCKANLSGFVYQRFEPFIVNLSSSVCEGQSVNLSVNAPTAVSYLWSPNASNAVTSSVQVVPVLPSSTYFVTVTNDLGCKTVANASVSVHAKPVVSITGGNTICIGQTTTMSPSSGGTWVALNPSVATISQTGIVTGTGFGNARFLFTNTTTGCTSDTSGIVSVNSSTNIAFVGPSSVCAGDQTLVSPGSGGNWVSSNSSVATVNNAGVVVAVSPGVAQLTYTNNLGCTTNGSLTVTVHDKPAILLDGPAQICIGSTTRFLPSNGGTWTTSHASIASINNSGLVTGISQGTARFVYTNAFTGCKSDSSTTITILPRPVVQITGNNPICVGSSTTLSPNSGGMWMSSNAAVASVTNAGVVTGLGQGNVTFTFTNNTTGCSSLPTATLIVNARPVVSVTGPNGICIGGTTTLSPSTGGTWSVVNPTVASVTNAGLVTGVSAGSTGFVFTNTTTGCISNATNNVTVYGRPTVNINSTSVCVGATTTVTPSTGGVWTSSNSAVATVNGSGLVTAVSAGQVTFTFVENTTGCISNPTATLQVFGKPIVSITGPTNICVGQTTTLQPISGGAWSSLSPSVATISNSGVVTGIANGSAQFVFTSNQGCVSDPSGNVTVNARPSVTITGPNPVCIGNNSQLSPASGGIWVSSHPSVASVTNAGLITGISAGTARFVFTQTSTGCSSDSTSLISVNGPPVISLIGSPAICIGQTSQVSPTTGGTWTALNPTIATISNTGLITGVSSGLASFRFVQSSTGCENTLSDVVTVRPRPDITLTGSSQICIGATTQFTPTSGGTWTSLMTSVATINNSGLVTGINQGQATFRFTSAATGCTSFASAPVTVLGRPTVLLDGPNSICIGSVTQVLPNNGGSWVSTNPSVATVSNTGLVTGVAQGNAQFVFTDENTGCISNPTTGITVFSGATVSLSGPAVICSGYNTTLSSSSSGVWYSTNSLIAKVSSNGMVTGIAPGKVSFYFQESGTGCLTYLPDDILTVTQCIDADFNVTAVNVSLTGDVNTNDEVPAGTTYSTSPYLIGKPDGSLATLTMLNNGKYTFTANKPGEYRYNVPVCIPGMGSSCPVSTLIITVVNPFTQSHNLITNLDITYTIQNQPVNFSAQVNDECISASGCMIDPQMISVVSPPNHGNAVIQTDGSVLYTPASGFIGFDTLTYQVCATNDSGNCRNAQLIVTVMSSDASNSLAAADDFYAITKGGSVNGANVLLNDFDPEGGNISIVPQGDAQNPVVSVAGSYYINSEGVLHFETLPTFTGPFDIVYTICDSVSFCVKATAHILVVDNMKLRIRAYLEGALMENKDAVSSAGRPLMRDDLRNNKFTNSNLIPSIDPYSNPVGFIDIRHNFQHVGSANSSLFTTIQNPQSVFAVTGENAIVDWVFIELRSKENYGEVIGTRSALIQRDGDVVDLDGVSFVEFPGLNVDSCFVVLKHRNHLGVMSQKISTADLVDFTSPSTPVFDFGTSKNDGYNYTGLAQKADVALGYMSLWAGDFDGNGKIKFVNPDDDQNFLFIEVLFYSTNTDYVANYNFVHGYLQGDYDLNGKSKYDNPDDDKNMLFYQVLFHPLNTNYGSNFNFITEQIPPKNIN